MAERIPCTIETIQIDGKEYLTTSQFGALSGRSAKTINHLMLYGNRARKMKSVLRLGARLVPVEELKDFPFTGRGRYGWRDPLSADGVSKGLPGIEEITR